MRRDEELKARTKAYAVRVVKLVEALPQNRTAEVIGRQLLRAATSEGNALVAIAVTSIKTARQRKSQ